MCAERGGRSAEARRHLERALGVAGQYVDVHIALGIVDFQDGRVGDARRHFERAIELEGARRDEVAVWLGRTAGHQ
jgi:Flp pilus assembly protein TadD